MAGRKSRCQHSKPKQANKGLPLRTVVTFYYALGTGEKRVFRNRDAVPGYRSRIPNPRSYSYAHVFVDGILQSPLSYRLRTGRLQFVSTITPPASAPITTEFIAIFPIRRTITLSRKKKAPSSRLPKRKKKELKCCCKKCKCCCKSLKRITPR